MNEAADLVQRYLETWNETDPDRRLAAIEDVWAEVATYVDPLANVAGRTQISNLIGAVHAVTRDDGRLGSVLGFLDKAPAA
jgi:hypothetical protein